MPCSIQPIRSSILRPKPGTFGGALQTVREKACGRDAPAANIYGGSRR